MADGAKKDLYGMLGVPRDADEDAIRKAYRQLARRYHPDVNPGDEEAEETFKTISEAYAVLSDPERRRNYDEFREISLEGGFDAERAPGGAPQRTGPSRSRFASSSVVSSRSSGFSRRSRIPSRV